MYNWIKETKNIMQVFRSKNEPMGFVLPTPKRVECKICGVEIPKRRETLGNMDWEGNITWYCCDDHWLEDW